MDLGKFLRQKKEQVNNAWQNSVVLDAVSANTQADQARRVQAGQPAQFQDQQNQIQQRRLADTGFGGSRGAHNAITSINKPRILGGQGVESTYSFNRPSPANLGTLSGDTEQQIRTAKFGVLANNPQAQQELIDSTRPSTLNPITALFSSAAKTPQVVGTGVTRSLAGTAEDFGGVYDLATPGLGTNRFTKKAVEFGKGVDNYAKSNGIDPLAYKISQGVGEALQFLSPGAIAKVVEKGAKLGGTTGKIARAVGKTEPLINKPGVKYLTTPANLLNAGVGTTKQLGYTTAREGDVGPKEIATALATNLAFGKGLNLLGKGTDKLKQAIVKDKPILQQTGIPAQPGSLRERIQIAKESVAESIANRTRLGESGSAEVGGPLIPIPKSVQKKLAGAEAPAVKQSLSDSLDNSSTGLGGADKVFGQDGTAWKDYNNRYKGGRIQTAKSQAEFDLHSEGALWGSSVDRKILDDVLSGNKKVGFVENLSYEPMFGKLAKNKGLYTREMNGVTVAGKSKVDVDRYVEAGNTLSKQEEHNLIGYKPERFATQKSPTQSLINEAKRYKSAEEFRKSLIYNDDIVFHETGSDTVGRINKDGFTTGKENGLGEKRGEVYAFTTYDRQKHGKISKDNYARDGSPAGEVAIDTGGMKILDRTKQKFTDEEYVAGVHKAIPEGYDGVKVGYGNGVNEVLLTKEAANRGKVNLTDIYNQANKPVMGETPTVKPSKGVGTPNYEAVKNDISSLDKNSLLEGALKKYPSDAKLTPAEGAKLVAGRQAFIDSSLKDFNKKYGTDFKDAFDLEARQRFMEDAGRTDIAFLSTNILSGKVDKLYSDSTYAKKLMDDFYKPTAKPKQPLSQPLDTTPAIARQVTKQTSTKPILGTDLSGVKNVRTASKLLPIEQSKPADLLPQNGRNQSASSSQKLNADEYVSQLTKAQKEAAKGGDSKLGLARKEFATKGLDALSPIEKPVEKAIGGREANYQLRDKLDRSLRSDTIAGQYAKDNGLADIIKTAPDIKKLDQYLIAKHAVDLEGNGIKTGRNLVKDAQLVKQLSPEYEAHAKAIGEYNQKLLDKTVDYGLISKETASYLKEKYPNYVPFDRIFKDGELNGGGNGSGPASLSTQTVIQRIKGSERQIQPPTESILSKTKDVIAQGERNQAAQAIAATKDLPGNPLGLKEIKPNETIGNRPTISYLENGVKRVFETTPEVAQAAKSLNKQQLGLVGKILSYPTRALRLGATGVNVGFAAANVTKDLASAFINSKHPLESSIANPRVFLDALKAATHHGGKQYGELVREGAGGTSFDIARNSAPQTVGKIRAERNIGTKALYTVRHPSELLRAVEDTIGRSEEFGRAIQYYGNKEAALKAGKSASEAVAYGADAARNNTVNFARAGEYGRVANSVLPYFNAGIQGSRTLARNLRDRPVQTGAKIVVSAFVPVAATTAWNLNDPERKAAYDDISEYEKQGNIIIVPPNPKKDPKTGRWNVIKIPVSQEVANLNNTVRNGVEALKKDQNFNFAGMAGDLAGTATSIPLGTPRQAVGTVIPQGLKPIIETQTNKNLFTGNPIVPESKKQLDAADQYGDNTSGTAKVLGRNLHLSPYQIDNVVRTAFGGAGQTAVNVSDNALAKAGVINPDEVKGKNLGNSITNRFTSAQGQSDYAVIDKTIKSKSDELKKTNEYKSLSADDKAKALNRLKNDVITATSRQVDAKLQKGQYAQDFTGKQTKLSKRQAGILDGTTDVKSYLTTQAEKTASGDIGDLPPGMNGYDVQTLERFASLDETGKDDLIRKEPDAEYKLTLAQYERDKKLGKISKVEDIKRSNELAKAKTGKDYAKEIREFYSLNKKDVYSYLSNNDDGKDVANKLLAYDDALVEAGVIEKNKFRDKYGNVTFNTDKYGGKGRGSRGGRSLDTTGRNAAGSLQVASLKRLTQLLGGTSKPVTSKKVAVRKAVLKNITVRA